MKNLQHRKTQKEIKNWPTNKKSNAEIF